VAISQSLLRLFCVDTPIISIFFWSDPVVCFYQISQSSVEAMVPPDPSP